MLYLIVGYPPAQNSGQRISNTGRPGRSLLPDAFAGCVARPHGDGVPFGVALYLPCLCIDVVLDDGAAVVALSVMVSPVVVYVVAAVIMVVMIV